LLARSVAAALGGSTSSQWLAQGIVILTALLGPPVSQAADYWGRKWFIVVLSCFGVVGSLVVARADTMGQAIAGEVIFGLAYGAQPLLFAVGSEILPRRVRPAAQAGLTITGAMGAIVGILGGAALTKSNPFGFRTYWYISTGIIAAATITCAILYNPPPRPLQTQLTTREKLARLDWVAYALLTVGITLFVMGLSWGDNPYTWNDAHVVAPLVIGAVFLLALIGHQTFIKKDGLINHRLFKKDRNFAICFFAIFIDGIIFWAANNYYAFQVSVLYQPDSFLAGLSYSITFITGFCASFFIAWFSSKTKLLREPLVGSFLMFTIFNSKSSQYGLEARS
jgi:MFS family permease